MMTASRSTCLILVAFLLNSLSIQQVTSFSIGAGAGAGGDGSSQNRPARTGNNNEQNQNQNQNQNLSASQQARRDEERRRKERTNEAVPGKTSAIPGAKDFDLNIQRTEYEWLEQASVTEQRVKDYTDNAMESLRMLQLEKAEESFDTVYKMKPSTYCWQAGIVKFYLGHLTEAVECFENNVILYETKFGQVASEERIWRDASHLKILSTQTKKERKNGDNDNLRSKALDEIDQSTLLRDSRKVVRIARDLFSSSIENDISNVALARAKLRSICGEYDSKDGGSNQRASLSVRSDRKMWRLSAWFFLGLHYDVMGDAEQSKDCMKMALRQCANGNGDDIMHTLPMLHMARRDWYDDDDYEDDTGDDFIIDDMNDVRGSKNNNSGPSTNNQQMVSESIEESVAKMRVVDLQSALKKRSLKSSGSKSVLQERLLQSLLEENGRLDN